MHKNQPKEINGKIFSIREIQIISFLVNGRSVKFIARSLKISSRTTESYIQNIMEKLECSSRTQLIEILEKSDIFKSLNENYIVLLKKQKKKKYVITIMFILIVSLSIYIFSSRKNVIKNELKIPEKSSRLERVSVLKKMEQILKKQNGMKFLILHGIGGSGKTTLSRQYALSSNDEIIWEINAENDISLFCSLKELAENLLKDSGDKEMLYSINNTENIAQTIKFLLAFVQKKLKAKDNKWLLIFDNVTNFNAIARFIPRDSKIWGSGKIIITTRDENILENYAFGSNNTLKTEELHKKEILELWNKNRKKNNSQKLANKIIRYVPPFPLDTCVAASSLNDSENFAANQNLPTNTEDRKNIFQKARKSIVETAIKNILDKNKKFLELFIFISLIDSQKIPLQFMAKYYGHSLINSLVYYLKKNSFIVQHSTHHISLHRSIHYILSDFFEKKGIHVEQINKNLKDYCTSLIREVDISKMQQLLPHISEFSKNVPTYHSIQTILGIFYYYAGDVKASQYYLTKNIKILTTQESSYLGTVEKELGNYEKAKSILESVLLIQRKKENLNNPDLAWTALQLGNIYTYLKRYQEAIEILNLSIKIYANLSEDFKVHLGWGYAHLAFSYRMLGDNEKELYYYRTSYAVLEKAKGKHHFRTAWTAIRLGNTLHEMGYYKEAEEILSNSLKIYAKYYHYNHDNLAWSYTRLGSLYRTLGVFSKARLLLEKGSKISADYYGDDHIKTCLRNVYLAQILIDIGEIDKAISLLKKSLEIHQKHFPKNHVKFAWIRHNMANAYLQLKEYQKAEELFVLSLEKYQSHYGINHVETAYVLRDFARLHVHQNQLDMAEKKILNALKIFKKENHPALYSCFEIAADIASKQKNNPKMQKYLNRALEIAECYFLENSAHVVRIKRKIPKLYHIRKF